MIFADVRLRGVMDGIDLAREVKMRWPLLPVILTSGLPRERVGDLPPGVAYIPKPCQLLNVLIAAEQALASARVAGPPIPARSTSERDRSGRACCGTQRSTSRVLNRLPPSFSARVASTNVRRGLPVASVDTVETER
jgi:DNA-binding NtrC family response regulator